MIESKQELQQIIETLFEQIEDLVKGTTDKPKSIFDIAGINRRENINSNILAYFLDKKENHGFEGVFFESLCEMIGEEETKQILDSDFEVIREYEDIDILIASRSTEENQSKNVFDWAILIEHKIHHKLDNPLRDYWERVEVIKGGFKKGIVLSPWGQEDKSLLSIYEKEKPHKHITDYLDFKHRDWMDKVRSRLPEFYLTADNYNLTVLKDLLNNIESMYMSHDERDRLESQINVLQDNLSEVNKIIKLEQEAKKYILSESIKVMKKIDFKPQNEYYSSTGKDFFPIQKEKKKKEGGNIKDQEVMPKYFKFYFWYPAFIEEHELNLHFYLDDEYVQYAEELRKDKTVIAAVNKFPSADIDDKKPHHLIHIEEGSFKNFSANNTFYNHLHKRMNEMFFKKETGLIWICADALDKLIETKKGSN